VSALVASIRSHSGKGLAPRVFEARDVEEVQKACKQKPIGLVLVGYSVPPSDKRRFFTEARKHCKTPVLELFATGKPELVDETRTLCLKSG
jgi:hypothetical protein